MGFFLFLQSEFMRIWLFFTFLPHFPELAKLISSVISQSFKLYLIKHFIFIQDVLCVCPLGKQRLARDLSTFVCASSNGCGLLTLLPNAITEVKQSVLQLLEKHIIVLRANIFLSIALCITSQTHKLNLQPRILY